MIQRILSLFILLTAVATPALGAAPGECLVAAAREQIGVTVHYDGRYVQLSYPGGDVPLERGVCTDVLIRAYRELGVDLQQLVHEDMTVAWERYPKLWGLARPDSNIDHRRVPNLATYFARMGQSLGAAPKPELFLPGDIVTWRLSSGVPHIGLISGKRSAAGVPLVIHNIGAGVAEEDLLLAYTITGHYRYVPENLDDACDPDHG